MAGIKEVANRNFVMITTKKSFYTWIKNHTEENYSEDLVLKQKQLFAVPIYVNEMIYIEEFVEEFKENIFFTMINDYEAYCNEEEYEKICIESKDKYFDYIFIYDCIDIPDFRLPHRKIRTKTYKYRKYVMQEE